MPAKYVIGIDLGTTNSALAYAPLGVDKPEVQLLPIPQLVAPGMVENRQLLPSFLYLASKHEGSTGAYDIPWAQGRDFAVGEMALRQSAELPDRTVSAAKSWLCHSRVDRHQAILPWNAGDDIPKVSPVTASRRYLEHLIAAWETAHPDALMADQQVILTVPASFDASARELTREAASAAGLPDAMILLEEPQSAVYAWLTTIGERWRKVLKVNDTLLVCDVGGGTTDLTLVRVTEEEGELTLKRVAVGNHLLVGGDNMDLALAHHVAGLFAKKGVNLDPWQSVSLWHSCRQAKEVLLTADGPKKHPISVLGRGSKLIGGTVTVDVAKEVTLQLLADGFFPACKVEDKPARNRASGFQEVGLPYEADAAITKHLASFLQSHGSDEGPARPTHVLFNGGVFKADPFRTRLLDALKSWFPEQPPQILEGVHDLDHAVARGAAYYGWAKEKGGVRIRGGTARSYYIGIETAGLAIPGAPRPLRALCVVPFGMEEGTEVEVPSDAIGLIVGQPAHFRFFSSATRKDDSPGVRLQRWTDDEIVETDSLEATLAKDDAIDDHYVPVQFHTRLTELGVLELWCVSTRGSGRWKLEFSVREDVEGQ
ncbi:Hsp70 family protein [Schlesneria paludicola]|uniref:Hsp70 family protein n=1 Tax=Schlesneria paludicola TaxID=360056 RepID=UPI00029AAAAB|nr:Hsp70 family protein [Schlesneria paludicola]